MLSLRTEHPLSCQCYVPASCITAASSFIPQPTPSSPFYSFSSIHSNGADHAILLSYVILSNSLCLEHEVALTSVFTPDHSHPPTLRPPYKSPFFLPPPQPSTTTTTDLHSFSGSLNLNPSFLKTPSTLYLPRILPLYTSTAK